MRDDGALYFYELHAPRTPDEDEGFRSLLVDLEPEDRRWGDA